MLNRPQILYALHVILCVTLLTFATGTMAQSGRRVHKPMPVPVPTVEPTPSPTPAEKPKPGRTFIIGIDRHGSFSNISSAVYDAALRSCAEQLDEPTSVQVEVAQRDMTRAEAIKRAKAEKEAYVVWLQIGPAMMSGDTGSGGQPDIWIEYSVFEPATAKLRTTGRSYRRDQGRSILRPRTGDLYGDYALNQAAREAAERILSHFKIPGSGRFP